MKAVPFGLSGLLVYAIDTRSRRCRELLRSDAVTRLPSADGQFWDIQDTSPWAQDSGGIATGGRANPFNGFGYLKLQVRLGGGRTCSTRNQYLRGFGLAHDGAERFDSITPVAARRHRRRPRACSRRRTRTISATSTASPTSADEPRTVSVAWGGAAGAFDDGGPATVAATSNGDRAIDLTDSFVTVMQNAQRVTDPLRGPSGHGPSAHVLGTATSGLLTSGRRHVRRSVCRLVSWLRSGAHRLRLHVHRRARPDGRADDVRRQRAERGLRSARRLSDPDARRARGAEEPGAVLQGSAGDSGGRIGDCEGHGRGAPARRGSGPARADAAAARADRQLAPARRSAAVRSRSSRRRCRSCRRR